VGAAEEIARLQGIMQALDSTASERHELFFDTKQRKFHSSMPRLIAMSNLSFMDIFPSGKSVEMDAAVQAALLSTVFEAQIWKRSTDKRLRKLASDQPKVRGRACLPQGCRSDI
jgi:hypothetical protein